MTTTPTPHAWWSRRLGAGWVPPVLATLTFVLTFAALEPRGTNQWGLWLLEAVDRVQPWLHQPNMWSATAIQETWAPHSALPPLAILAAALTLDLLPELGTMGAAQLVAQVAVALTVPLVWGLGRRAGGPPGGAAAVIAYVTTPRTLGAATSVGFDALAMFGVTFAMYALYRARTSALWTAVAALALALAVLSTHVAVLLLVPWTLLTLSDKGQVSTLLIERGRDPGAPDGFFRAASFPPRLLTIMVVAPALLWLLYPWLWKAPISRLGRYLGHFLTQPKPTFLYLTDHVDADRLPWHAALVLLLVTVPIMTAVLGTIGLIGEMALRPWFATRLGRWVRAHLDFTPDPEAAGPEAQEAKRWSFASLLTLLIAPWLVGAPVWGVVDLLALAIPFWSIFVGCALSRLLSVTTEFVTQIAAPSQADPQQQLPPRQLPFPSKFLASVVLAGFATLSFTPSIIDAISSHPYEASYYSRFIGGTRGAVQQGLHRAPFAPTPWLLARALEAHAVANPKSKAAFVLPDPNTQRILERYRASGLIRAVPAWGDLYTADILILIHDDLNPNYYAMAHSFAQSVPPEHTQVLSTQHVRRITLGFPNPTAQPSE
ncbi:MAG: glycosyltransferase family 39 protein [Myxococcota bacterium]